MRKGEKNAPKSMETIVYIPPMLETWIIYLQNSSTPTISLVLSYMMEDLIKVSDDLEDKADRTGNAAAEKLLSRIQVELSEDFKEDLVDDFLRLAHLLDPRICNRTMPFTGSEIDRLLWLLLKYLPDIDEGEDVIEGEDAFDAPREDYTAEFNAFKAHMRKVKVKVIGAQDEAESYKYYGGVHRREDVNMLAFY